jgi:hypothetical protein
MISARRRQRRLLFIVQQREAEVVAAEAIVRKGEEQRIGSGRESSFFDYCDNETGYRILHLAMSFFQYPQCINFKKMIVGTSHFSSQVTSVMKREKQARHLGHLDPTEGYFQSLSICLILMQHPEPAIMFYDHGKTDRLDRRAGKPGQRRKASLRTNNMRAWFQWRKMKMRTAQKVSQNVLNYTNT